MTRSSRRTVLATLATGSVALAGCQEPSTENAECEGDCDRLEEIEASVDTSFGTNKTSVSVSFQEPFTGSVTVDLDGVGETRHVTESYVTTFEFDGTHMTVERIILQEGSDR